MKAAIATKSDYWRSEVTGFGSYLRVHRIRNPSVEMVRSAQYHAKGRNGAKLGSGCRR